jgi:hypothetical protein
MPTTLNSDYLSKYTASEIPSTISPPWGDKHYIRKRGFRFALGDQKDQVLAYSGQKHYGRVWALPSDPRSQNNYYEPIWYGDAPYSGQLGTAGAPPTYGQIAWNRCYDKFKEGAFGTTASIGATVAEGREAFGMIAQRAIGLRRAYKELRHGNFRKFLRELQVDPKRKHRSKLRSAASEASGLWLEYWFGWSPLLGDIYNSVDVLTSPYPVKGFRYHAAARETLEQKTKTVNGATITRSHYESGRYVVKTGATVRVTNWNLHLASQLGLINPASIAWELVPFSFVVDWFAKCGNVIEAYTDFAGVDLDKAYTTQFTTVKGRYSTGVKNQPATWTWYDYVRFNQIRSTGLIFPVVLHPVNMGFGHSLTRAATAVSLLQQIFLTGK